MDRSIMMYSGHKDRLHFVTLINVIIFSGLIFWVAMFAVSRIHMLHTSYSSLRNERENDVWLSEQCKQDEFYHKMKHHSTLCDSVHKKQSDILILMAVNNVIENTYMCGYESCGSLMIKVGDYLLGRGIVITGSLFLLFLLMPTLLLPLFRRRLNVMADDRMQQLYNRPYGNEHYIHSHPSMKMELLN